MKVSVRLFCVLFLLALPALAQQRNPSRERVEKTAPPTTTTAPTNAQPATEQPPQTRPESETMEGERRAEQRPAAEPAGAGAAAGRKFWNLQGDIEAFGEFIRLYISRNERWSSPLYLLGESYGTTRAAGISGYLTDHGINFAGIMLLSEVLNFQTLEFAATNDVPYPLILPTFTMTPA